jgi:hypothetical protein
LTEGLTAGSCARGSAIKAAWAYDGNWTSFEEFVRVRWNTIGRLDRVVINEDQNVWDQYGLVLDSYKQCEEIILTEN